MRVPLTIRDFLDRAEQVYPDRVGVVDEPDQPAPSLGELTYREMARRARAQAAGLDELGVAVGGRVAIVSQNSARLLDIVLRRVRRRAGCWCRSTSGSRPRRSATSSSTPAPRVLFVDPELEDVARRARRPSTIRARRGRRALLPLRRRAAAVGRAGRGRHRHDQLHLAAPPRGPRACSSPTATSGSTRSTFGLHTQVSDRDVYLHTLPMFHATAGACRSRSPASAASRSCCARSTAPRSCAGSSEHGVTLMCAAPAVVERRARRRRRPGTARSPAATGCASSSPARRRRPAPSSGSRPSSAGSSSRSTASPRPRRCSPSTGRAPSGTTSSREERAKQARRGPARRRSASRLAGRRRRRGARRVQPHPRRLLGAARTPPPRRCDGGWFHTGDGGRSTTTATSTISDRKKDVIITGGENVSSIEVEDA